MEQGYALGDHDRAKTLTRGSSHQDAIAGNQLDVRGRPYKDGIAAVLQEEQMINAARIANSRFKRDGNNLAGFGIRQGVNGVQSGERGGRRYSGSHGTSKNQRE